MRSIGPMDWSDSWYIKVFLRCESIRAVRLARKIRVCTVRAAEVIASGGFVAVRHTGDGLRRPKYRPRPPGWPSCACKVYAKRQALACTFFMQTRGEPNDNRGTVVSTVEAAVLLQVTA